MTRKRLVWRISALVCLVLVGTCAVSAYRDIVGNKEDVRILDSLSEYPRLPAPLRNWQPSSPFRCRYWHGYRLDRIYMNGVVSEEELAGLVDAMGLVYRDAKRGTATFYKDVPQCPSRIKEVQRELSNGTSADSPWSRQNRVYGLLADVCIAFDPNTGEFWAYKFFSHSWAAQSERRNSQ